MELVHKFNYLFYNCDHLFFQMMGYCYLTSTFFLFYIIFFSCDHIFFQMMVLFLYIIFSIVITLSFKWCYCYPTSCFFLWSHFLSNDGIVTLHLFFLAITLSFKWWYFYVTSSFLLGSPCLSNDGIVTLHHLFLSSPCLLNDGIVPLQCVVHLNATGLDFFFQTSSLVVWLNNFWIPMLGISFEVSIAVDEETKHLFFF